MRIELLRQYVRMLVAEDAHLARVPQQLVSADSNEEEREEEVEDVKEFSAAGAAMGYIAPGGSSTDAPALKLLQKKKKRST